MGLDLMRLVSEKWICVIMLSFFVDKVNNRIAIQAADKNDDGVTSFFTN